MPPQNGAFSEQHKGFLELAGHVWKSGSENVATYLGNPETILPALNGGAGPPVVLGIPGAGMRWAPEGPLGRPNLLSATTAPPRMLCNY